MLTAEELVSIIDAHRADSLGVENGELSNERSIALDRYHGRPYGNEMEGRSAVVSKDLSEAVDWAMPAIMRVFTQSGSVAEFSPVSPEDEAQAEIETEYVNQVLMKDNQGWIVLHDAIKDTLLLKNGYVKHWWEETEKVEEVEYQGLVIEELQRLMADLQMDGARVEIVGQEELEIVTQMGAIPVFNIKLKIIRKHGCVRVEAVPCEEIRISRKARGHLNDSPFVEHVTLKTRSDLIEMGMERDFVELLPAYNERQNSGQVLSRDSVSDESNSILGYTFTDRAMDEIEYCEAYIRVDWDGDGIAELRRVVTVGNKIPDGEEWNKPIPECAITGFVAKRVPHRHVGESIYDDLGDLQEIKTVLLRQMLDNIYATNNNQWLVNERVNLSDFMTSLPGGIKRIEGLDAVQGAVSQVMVSPIANQILPVVDYIDGIKESRTGISKASAGLDTDTLSNVTKGAFMENMNRASQKIEMITRMIAETGVKEMVLRVHSLLCRYQDKQRMIRMKGKFITVNPQEWKERTDLTVKVGLGTGNEEDRQRKLMLMADMSMKLLAPQGMVGAKQAFSLYADIGKTLGFDMPDKYALNPESPEYQQKMSQPQPNPALQVEQMKLQADIQKFQADAQQTAQLEQLKAQLKQQEIQKQLELQAANDARDAEREAMKAQHAMQLEAHKLELDRYRIDKDNETRILVAQIQAANEQNTALMDHEVQIKGIIEQAKASQGNDQVKAIMQGLASLISQQGKPRKVTYSADGRIQGVE